MAAETPHQLDTLNAQLATPQDTSGQHVTQAEQSTALASKSNIDHLHTGAYADYNHTHTTLVCDCNNGTSMSLYSDKINGSIPVWGQWTGDTGGGPVRWSSITNPTPIVYNTTTGIWTNEDNKAHTLVITYTLYCPTTANAWDCWIQVGSGNDFTARLCHSWAANLSPKVLTCAAMVVLQPLETFAPWCRVFNSATQTGTGARMRFICT